MAASPHPIIVPIPPPTPGPQPGPIPAPIAVPLPGGSAEFFADEELTMGQTRDLELHGATLVPLIHRIVDAAVEGVPDDLTAEEIDDLREYNDRAVLAYLKGWTLDRALPTKFEELRALPADLHEALATHAAELAVARRAGFAIGPAEQSTAA